MSALDFFGLATTASPSGSSEHLVDRCLHPEHPGGRAWAARHRPRDVLAAAAVCAAADGDRPDHGQRQPAGRLPRARGSVRAGNPPAGCSNPGPIDSGDDRMRDTMMTTLAGGPRIMWGGLGTVTGGGRAGICSSGSTSGAASSRRAWPAVGRIDNPSRTTCSSRPSRFWTTGSHSPPTR